MRRRAFLAICIAVGLGGVVVGSLTIWSMLSTLMP